MHVWKINILVRLFDKLMSIEDFLLIVGIIEPGKTLLLACAPASTPHKELISKYLIESMLNNALWQHSTLRPRYRHNYRNPAQIRRLHHIFLNDDEISSNLWFLRRN